MLLKSGTFTMSVLFSGVYFRIGRWMSETLLTVQGIQGCAISDGVFAHQYLMAWILVSKYFSNLRLSSCISLSLLRSNTHSFF